MNTLHAAFVVSTILFAGCATMINGPRQDIPVRSDPEGAKVHADCGELQGDVGATPLILAVPRIATDCSLTLSKSGYAAKKIVFERQLSRAVAANKAIGVPVGIFGAIITALFGGSQPYLDPQGAFDGGVEIGAAPGKQIDKRSGGAYKQVPGEVTIRLEQIPTGSPISSDWHRMDPDTYQPDKLLATKTEAPRTAT